jgi:hypothetical protein
MRGVSENLNTATARFNFPVFAHIDLGADFDHGWIGGPFSGHVNEFSGTATVFGHFVAVSPFAKARFGTIRSNSAFGKEDHRIWRVTGGVEIPFSRLTITPMAIYDDDDQDAPNSIKEWTYEALLHYWFTPKIGGFASLGKTDFKNSDIDPKNYKAGLTFRF